MFSQRHVCFTTGLLKSFKLFGFLWIITAVGNSVDKIIWKHKWNSFPIDPKLFLVMAQEVTKVNVEDLTIFIDHDIVWMSVSDAKDEGCHTVAGTRVGECLDGLL